MSNTYPVRYSGDSEPRADMAEVRSQGTEQLQYLLLNSGVTHDEVGLYISWLFSVDSSLPEERVRGCSTHIRSKYVQVITAHFNYVDQFSFIEQEMLGLVFGRTANPKDKPRRLKEALTLFTDARERVDFTQYERHFWTGVDKLARRYQSLPQYLKDKFN